MISSWAQRAATEAARHEDGPMCRRIQFHRRAMRPWMCRRRIYCTRARRTCMRLSGELSMRRSPRHISLS
eukprot:6996937-Pyramimonas_sp.AAC.1